MIDVEEIRSHFPSLQSGAIYFDNPGGTQVPKSVIDAVDTYYKTANSNTHGVFATSRLTDEIIAKARIAMADFLNAESPREIVFGPNMTTLTFHLSRSLGRLLRPGDEIIVTHMDHDANIAPWLSLAECGAVIKWVDIKPKDCTLKMADFEKLLSMKTKIVAVGYASNAVGTINDLKKIIEFARAVDALVFIDAVHYAPHGPIDVVVLDCDFLVCSAYKFFGPHVGILYGKHELLERLYAYKVRPAEDTPPEKFETGTQNHEGLAGLCAAIDYLAEIGELHSDNFGNLYTSFTGRRASLKKAMSTIQLYERDLLTHLIEGLQDIKGLKLYGIMDIDRFKWRTPTIALTMHDRTPREIAGKLSLQNIYVWDGNYYALALMERLGLQDNGGAVRIGLAHYNTIEEINMFLSVMEQV